MIISELYHGTDARLIEMSECERIHYMGLCKFVIDNVFPIFDKLEKDLITIDVVYNGQNIKVFKSKLEIEYRDKLDAVPYLYSNLLDKLSIIRANRNGDGNYQYGSLYLTSFRPKAEIYAHNATAGGEFGLTAYRLIQAVEIIKPIDFNPSTEVCAAIKTIKAFAGDKTMYKPVVITLKDIDSSDLLRENGNEITGEEALFLQDFRYSKDIVLSLDNAEYL